MDTLKFLMVSSHYPPACIGGDAIFVKYLSEELWKRGHDVHIFYSPRVFELLRRNLGDLISNRTESKGINSPIMHAFEPRAERLDPLVSYIFGWQKPAVDRIKELVRDIKPDIIHWHNTIGFISNPIAFDNAMTLLTTHDFYLVCPKSSLMRLNGKFCKNPLLCQICLIGSGKPPQLGRLGKRRIIKIPSGMKILSPSQYMADRLQSFGVEVYSILRNFAPDPGEKTARMKCEQKYLLYLGILEPHKGIRTLVESFVKSRNKHDFRLYIVGNGSLKPELKRRILASGLDDRIRILGFMQRNDVDFLIKNASALIIPSEWEENAPLVALEGLSFGTPLIGSNLGGLPEILKTNSASMMFEAGNVDDLASKICLAWSRDNRLNEARRMAIDAYRKEFSPDVHITRYMKIIEATTS